MATIKSYTDIEQSRELAEILPLESADMCYKYVLPKSGKIRYIPEIENPINALEWYNKGYTRFGKEPLSLKEYCIPCWSLAALLDALPLEIETHKQTDGNKIYYYVESYMKRIENEIHLSTERHENLVDACVVMIEKLHELNLL